MDKPQFIRIENVISDSTYVSWLKEIKQRLRQAQAKAMVRVNSQMLGFYWSLGRDIVAMQVESKWGSNFFNQLSLDLKKEFPNETGFSATNLKYISRWYAFYYQQIAIRQRPVDEFEMLPNNEVLMPERFSYVPWGQHIEIITKCETLNQALFYINKTIENNWSRPELVENIRHNLFESLGSATTNFKQSLPSPQNDLAQEILKDPYNFDFLDLKAKHSEKELEDALIANITKFLLELGKGFAFVGRQMELKMPNGKTYSPDLIFYHTKLKSYVVVELKAVDFEPEFAGKINFYVSAVDNLLKDESDNQTIGLIICKSADKTTVEWSFSGVDRPIGVASYQIEQVVERTIKELQQANNKEDEGDEI